MTLGQRVAVMHDGRLEQVGPPMEVYGRPATRFVGGFVGSPAMNFFPCEVRRDGGEVELVGGFFRIRPRGPVGDGDGPGERAILGVRPNDVELASPPDGDGRGAVDVVEPLGSQVLVHLAPPEGGGGDEQIRALVPPDGTPDVGETVAFRFRRDRLHLFDPDSGRRVANGPI